jgi:hypothetical protein
MKKEAFIKLTTGNTFAIEIQELTVSTSFFAVVSLDVNLNEPLYMEIIHQKLNTSIDLTGIKDMVFIHFDDNDDMLGATYVLPKSSGSFGIITQSKRLLFLPLPINFVLEEVIKVSIS